LPTLDFMPDLARRARRGHDLLAFALLAALALDAGGAVTDGLRRRTRP
jgi:hypothetical protein